MSRQTKYVKARNNTGKTIVKGHITHATQDYGLQTIPINNLADGQETDAYEVYTGPSSRDYWYLSWSHDDQNFVAFSTRNALNGHESKNEAGSIALRGLIGNGALGVYFYTDGGSEDKYEIIDPKR
jgi:hypothetical protein